MCTEDTTKMAESPAHKISLRNLTNPNSRILLQNNQHGKILPFLGFNQECEEKKNQKIQNKTKQNIQT